MRDLKKSPFEIGDTSGIALSGIIVNDDYSAILTGRQGVLVYRQMLSDATVSSSLLAVTLPILSARWWVEPGGDKTRQDKKIAEFVEGELMERGTRTWQETLTEVLDYLVYGRMPFEIVWEFREDSEFGRPMIGLRKLARRDPATIFKWKISDGQPGVVQQTINGQFEIPMDKMIVFVNQKKGDNWEGVSLLRSAYKHWYIKDKLYLIDAISAERQGLGVPKGRVPVGAKQATKDKMEEVLRNLRANDKGYALLEGEDMEIDFMDMKAGQVKNLMPSIQHHDRAISLNVLAQFLQLGSTSVGSFALSNDQSKLFILCLEAIANHIRDNINRYLIKKLVDYNFDTTVYPELSFEKIGNVDHNILTTSLQRAIQTGVLKPQPEDEVYLRDVMDLPEKSDSQAVDPTLFDSMLMELNTAMGQLDGSMMPDAENPEEEAAPEEEPEQVAHDAWHLNKVAFEKKYGKDSVAEFAFIIKAGRPGEPLSEETKRKISEALKRRSSSGGKGKKKGKKTDPQVAADRKEIAGLRKQVREINNDSRRKLLELKAKGQKLTDEESAKMQLEVFDKRNKIMDQIDKLQARIEERKAATAGANSKESDSSKASEVGTTLDRINKTLDAYGKK